jgi:hypothetical protein
VLFHDLGYIPVVLVDDVIDSLLKLPCIFLLLSLKLLEFSSIFQHLLRILIPLFLKFDLELLC